MSRLSGLSAEGQQCICSGKFLILLHSMFARHSKEAVSLNLSLSVSLTRGRAYQPPTPSVGYKHSSIGCKRVMHSRPTTPRVLTDSASDAGRLAVGRMSARSGCWLCARASTRQL